MPRVARGERFKVPVYDARAPRARAKTVQAGPHRHGDGNGRADSWAAGQDWLQSPGPAGSIGSLRRYLSFKKASCIKLRVSVRQGNGSKLGRRGKLGPVTETGILEALYKPCLCCVRQRYHQQISRSRQANVADPSVFVNWACKHLGYVG